MNGSSFTLRKSAKLPWFDSEQEWDLLERGLNRVTDTCIPEHEAFRRLQKHIYKIWKDADDAGERYLLNLYFKKCFYQAF
jgi:hypothetical protein